MSKEKLPISFITTFISDGWDKVGILKEQKESLSKVYSGTKKFEDLLQDLIDAYLICIGQMELSLQDKNYIEMPDIEVVEADKKEIKEDLELINSTDETKYHLPETIDADQFELDDFVVNFADANEKPDTAVDTDNAFSGAFDTFCDF